MRLPSELGTDQNLYYLCLLIFWPVSVALEAVPLDLVVDNVGHVSVLCPTKKV